MFDMPEYSLKVLPEQSGTRLDLFIAHYSQENNLGLSRTVIQRLIKEGKVRLNASDYSLKMHYKVKAEDEFRVMLAEKSEVGLDAEDIPLQIIYEDDDLAVINKPEGLVVHPAPGNAEHTLVNALLNYFKDLSDINPGRPGIVHRLDKGTSGLMVIAKNNSSHLNLAAQFANHTIKKKYIALVKGRVEFDENTIELPIGRHPIKRKNMAVGFKENTRYAKTNYRTLKRFKNVSLLELEPFTGRTHQLRVHLSFIGHPILGDKKYGRDNAFPRLALHAQSLSFIHPRTNKKVEFSVSVPEEFLTPFAA